MSVVRPASRSLISRLAASGRPISPRQPLSRQACHAFHSSAQLSARRKPRFKNIRAAELGLTTPEAIDNFSEKHFPEYTPEEKEILSQRYTPQQMAALEAGEAAIDPRDLTIQGRLREDPARIQYLDDFSTIDPVVDYQPKTEPFPTRKAEFMSPDEFKDDMIQWAAGEDLNLEGLSDEEVRKKIEMEVEMASHLEETDEKQDEEEWMKFWTERESLVGKGGTGNTAIAPYLGDDIPGVTEFYNTPADEEDESRDPEGTYTELKRKSGMRLRDILSIPTKTIVTRSVVNQTRLGKIRRASVMVVAGNKDGRIGLGVAKSVDRGTAVSLARIAAIQNMKPIVRYENRTIYGNAEAKVSGTVVRLFSRPPGFGLRVPARIFEICRLCGISDLTARIPRSRNPMNSVKATIQALQSQKNPEDIAIGRGKKLVDARKVYYGGAVY